MKNYVKKTQTNINNFIFRAALIGLLFIKGVIVWTEIPIVDNVTLAFSIMLPLTFLLIYSMMVSLFVENIYIFKLFNYKNKLTAYRIFQYFVLGFRAIERGDVDKANQYTEIIRDKNKGSKYDFYIGTLYGFFFGKFPDQEIAGITLSDFNNKTKEFENENISF